MKLVKVHQLLERHNLHVVAFEKIKNYAKAQPFFFLNFFSFFKLLFKESSANVISCIILCVFLCSLTEFVRDT